MGLVLRSSPYMKCPNRHTHRDRGFISRDRGRKRLPRNLRAMLQR